jgi:tryptophan-rich sensory protein
MKKDKYLFYVNLFILLIVLVGFAPTFYLTPFNDKPGLSGYLIVHGATCTAWFVAVVLQSYYVIKGQLINHKKFGVYFSLLSLLLIFSGLVVNYYAIQSYLIEFPSLTDATISDKQKHIANIIVGNTVQLAFFGLLVFLGYRSRTKPGYHKRFMVFASILIIQQALVRIGRNPIFQIGEDAIKSQGTYVMYGVLILIVLLFIYDFIKLKKPHWATITSFTIFLVFFLIVGMMMQSGVGVAWIEKFR